MSAILNILIAIDVALFRIVTLGKAKPGETISAAAYRGEQTGKLMGRIFRPVIDLIFSFAGPQPHCKQAYEWQQDIYREKPGD